MMGQMFGRGPLAFFLLSSLRNGFFGARLSGRHSERIGIVHAFPFLVFGVVFPWVSGATVLEGGPQRA